MSFRSRPQAMFNRHIKARTGRTTIPCSSESVPAEMLCHTHPGSSVAFRTVLLLALAISFAAPGLAQDWIRTGTGLGVEKIRLAAFVFKPSSQDAKNANLLKTSK